MIDVNKVLEQRSVSSPRGAPMGRIEYCKDPYAPVYLQKVQFEDGDYDAGGAYWGGSAPLYCAMDAADTALVFLRATNWNEARDELLVLHPNLQVIDEPVVPDDARWWTDGSGCVELNIGLQDARGGSHSGSCDADIDALAQEPYIASQLAKLDAEKVKGVVSEYFADATDEELADHERNLERLLWLACGDLAEENVE